MPRCHAKRWAVLFVLLRPSGIKELLDLSPVSSNDVVRADVSAPLERFQTDSCEFRELLASFIRHMRIILGMKDHYLRRSDFDSMAPRAVERPAPQLFPVRIRKAISVPKCFVNIFGVTLFRSFDLFG